MKHITFTYSTSDFLNNALLLSMYRASSVSNNGADLPVDNIKLSEQDTSVIMKYLSKACSEIAECLAGYTDEVIESEDSLIFPYLFDDTFNEVENQIVYQIMVPDTFMPSNLPVIDESIKDGLESYLLYRTAKLRATEFQSFKEDWEDAKLKITSCLNRRSEPIIRSMNLI